MPSLLVNGPQIKEKQSVPSPPIFYQNSAALNRVKEKSSDHLKDLHKVKLLTNFGVNLMSSPGGIMN